MARYHKPDPHASDQATRDMEKVHSGHLMHDVSIAKMHRRYYGQTPLMTHLAPSAIGLLVIGFVCVSASTGHAAFYCVRNDDLPQVTDTRTKQSIESYLRGRYPISDFKIRQLEGAFFIAWPEHNDCKPCYHHIIQIRGLDLRETLVFEGGRAILFSDVNSAYDNILRDRYTYVLLKQANKSYLSFGIPRTESAPLVEASRRSLRRRQLECQSARYRTSSIQRCIQLGLGGSVTWPIRFIR